MLVNRFFLLLQDGQQERDTLLVKQKELMGELEEINRGLDRQKQESLHLKERVHLLESTVEATNAERNQLEQELTIAKEESSCKLIEISRLSTLLDNARCKVYVCKCLENLSKISRKFWDFLGRMRKSLRKYYRKCRSMFVQFWGIIFRKIFRKFWRFQLNVRKIFVKNNVCKFEKNFEKFDET